MNIYTDIESMPFIEQAVVTLGTFDGVHTAHRAILEEVCASATEMDGQSVVISFISHPRRVLEPDFSLNILTTTKEKNILLQQIGINNIIYIDFTSSLAQTNYVEFIRLLIEKIDIKKIVVGYNHNFGKNKEGNINTLTELIPIYDFDVVEIPRQTNNKIKISSSYIRKIINTGDFTLANSLLGYNYTIDMMISSVNNEKIILTPSIKEKILPPKGKYDVSINDETTLLEVDNEIYIQKKNISFIDKKEKEITIEFLNQQN